MRKQPLVLIPLAFAALVGLGSASSTPAHATKEYARKEKKDCTFCHINDKGAGARNAKGREYEANGYKFGVKSWTNDVNLGAYLRANSAYAATWYTESLGVLTKLEKTEKLPGGLALIEGRKSRMKIFPRTWLRSAKKLLAKGKRGLPNALNKFLVRLESQFPATDEGKEAIKLLDGLAKAKETKTAVDEARAREKLRVSYLEARTELALGNIEKGRKLLDSIRTNKLLDPAVKKAVDKLYAESAPSTD